jgi:hypothetical protein
LFVAPHAAEAYEHGGKLVGLLAMLDFALAFGISSLE